MKPILAAILALILASLACGTYITPTPTVSPTETPSDTGTPEKPILETPTRTAQPASIEPQTVTVSRAVVQVHDAPDPDSPVRNWLESGDVVTVIECIDDYCKIEDPAGWVFRGCLEGLAAGRGCQAK